MLVLAIALGACGAGSQGDDSDPGAGNPQSAGTEADFDQALADAPPRLASIYEQGDALLEGGSEAFTSQLDELVGYPVVVNKWASWCGPCRFEFPFFQSQAMQRGTKIAFLGVNSEDSAAEAESFLGQLPLPYPSYSDPDGEIADLFDAREFPSTAFYDSTGELVYVRRGGYASEEDLAAEIERWAR